MAELARLLADHKKLMEASESLLDTVSSPDSAPERAHAQLRDLALSIDAHLRLEHEMIRLAESLGAATFIPLSVHKGEVFNQLVGDWVGYLNSWPETDVRRDWAGFCAETLPIVRRVMVQIEDENRAVRTIMGRRG